MRVDPLKYVQLRIASTLYRRAIAASALDRKKCGRPVVDKACPLTNCFIAGKGGPSNCSAESHSPCRSLLILVLSILVCGSLIKYLFIFFPGLHPSDMPLISSAVLIFLLFPVLYAFVYRPMVRQFDALKRSEVTMREMALGDVLTGLYNRRGFLTFSRQLLKLSDRAQRGLILIYADLDQLKKINDDQGHKAGDEALVCMADVLAKTFRQSDVIGRVGGDEFAILALEARAESLDALRLRLNENLRNSRYNAAAVRPLTFSMGIIYYNPEKPQTIEELLNRADRLMYEDKSLRTTPRDAVVPVEDNTR